MRDHYYDWKKKILVVCLAGAKKDTIVCLADARSKNNDQKKKDAVIWRCAQSKLRPEKKGTVVWPAMFFEPPEKITSGKKRYSRLTDG